MRAGGARTVASVRGELTEGGLGGGQQRRGAGELGADGWGMRRRVWGVGPTGPFSPWV
jgi:hypothetical protein